MSWKCSVCCKALYLHKVVLLLLFKSSSRKHFSLDFTISPKSLQLNSPSIMAVVFHLRVTTGVQKRPINRAQASNTSIMVVQRTREEIYLQ